MSIPKIQHFDATSGNVVILPLGARIIDSLGGYVIYQTEDGQIGEQKYLYPVDSTDAELR